MENIIAVGAQAPDFKLNDQNGNVVELSALRGKKVLIASHPLAWTPVCLDQMRDLERNYDLFAEKNTVVLGLSIDTQYSKAAWAKAINVEKTQLLADSWPYGEVAKAYGIFSDEYGCSKRANILIDENGVVLWSKKYAIPELPDIAEVIAQLG